MTRPRMRMIPPVLLPWGEGVAVRPGVAVLGVAGLLQWRVVAGAVRQQQGRSLGLVAESAGTLHQGMSPPHRVSSVTTQYPGENLHNNIRMIVTYCSSVTFDQK